MADTTQNPVNWLNVLGGGLGTAQLAQQAGQIGNSTQKAVGLADPNAQYAPGYANQLNQMMTGQFSPTDPSYQWRYQQGLDALQRTGAAQGMTGSGNMMAELEKYGQGMASTEYGNQFNRLRELTGGSPAAAQATMQGQALQQAMQRAALTGGLQTAGQLFGGGGSQGGGLGGSLNSLQNLWQQGQQWMGDSSMPTNPNVNASYLPDWNSISSSNNPLYSWDQLSGTTPNPWDATNQLPDWSGASSTSPITDWSQLTSGSGGSDWLSSLSF